MLTAYVNLNEKAKAEVKRRYINWHYDKTVSTFKAWAKRKAFYVTKSGRLDNRYKHCEPWYLADVMPRVWRQHLDVLGIKHW